MMLLLLYKFAGKFQCRANLCSIQTIFLLDLFKAHAASKAADNE